MPATLLPSKKWAGTASREAKAGALTRGSCCQPGELIRRNLMSRKAVVQSPGPALLTRD